MKKTFLIILTMILTILFVSCSSSGDDFTYEHAEYTCDSCYGEGTPNCYYCDNTGVVYDSEYSKNTVCLKCLGKSTNPCRDCDGTGVREALLKVYKDGTKEFIRYND